MDVGQSAVSHQWVAVSENIAIAVDKVSHGAVAEKCREASSVVRELLLRVLDILKDKAAHSETVRLVKELGRSHLRLLARRLSVLSPLVHQALENRLAIAWAGLVLGFMGGQLWMRGYPQLQPQQMMSLVCGGYSGPEGVALCRIPVPRLTHNHQVLVRVMSAGLDRADLLSVSGWGRVERGKPHGGFTLGRDFCGVVLEAGRGVPHLAPGDKVWGATPYHAPGTLSEQVVVSGQCVTRMPANLNWEGGATVPYSTSLVWAALVTRGGLTPDQAAGARVLVLDCVTDTGVLATQLATMWGGHVTVTCSARAAQLSAALGAHNVTVVTEEESPDQVVARLARAGPYSLIVRCGDSPAGLTSGLVMSLVTPGTRLTSTLPTALPSDGWGCLRRALHPVWRSLIFSPPQTLMPSQITECLNYVRHAVQRGKLQPVLDTVLAPAEVGAALQRLATEEVVGKSIVLFDKL